MKLDTGRMSALARELETLLDNAQNEQVDLAGLSDLVPDELADNWHKRWNICRLSRNHGRFIWKASNALTRQTAATG